MVKIGHVTDLSEENIKLPYRAFLLNAMLKYSKAVFLDVIPLKISGL